MTRELAALNAGTWTDDRSTTLGQWLETWLDESAEHRSPKTMANGHVRDVWSPQLGHLRLRDLRRAHIEKVLRELGKPITGERPKTNAGRRVNQRQPRTSTGTAGRSARRCLRLNDVSSSRSTRPKGASTRYRRSATSSR
jgi:hypothetical protein